MMEAVQTVKGDLTEQNVDYIVHQCNCTSKGAKGLAKVIFAKFPETNIYSGPRRVPKPGEIYVLPTRGESGPQYVVNLVGQHSPGRPRKSETAEQRIGWFETGLETLLEEHELTDKTVAFPKNIGCGLAGGDWNEYLNVIQWFANQNRRMQVKVVELEA